MRLRQNVLAVGAFREQFEMKGCWYRHLREFECRFRYLFSSHTIRVHENY